MRFPLFLLSFFPCCVLAWSGALTIGKGAPSAAPGGTDTFGPAQVSASADDCTDSLAGDEEDCVDTFVPFGNSEEVSAHRWDNVTLLGAPSGRTVTSCTLQLWGGETYNATFNWNLYGVDENDPPPYGPAQSPGNTTEVPRTTSFQPHTTFNMVNDQYASFDCTAAVQALIETYTFNNEALGLVKVYVSINDYAAHRTYDSTPVGTRGAWLTFTYDY